MQKASCALSRLRFFVRMTSGLLLEVVVMCFPSLQAVKPIFWLAKLDNVLALLYPLAVCLHVPVVEATEHAYFRSLFS